MRKVGGLVPILLLVYCFTRATPKILNCAELDAAGADGKEKCKTCMAGSWPSTDGLVCDLCTAGCVACENKVCSKCVSNTYFNPSTATCNSCLHNCAVCDGPKCSKCIVGMYLSDKGFCLACNILNCLNCESEFKCSQCDVGYTMSSVSRPATPTSATYVTASTCNKQSASAGVVLLWISIAIVILIMIVCGGIFILR